MSPTQNHQIEDGHWMRCRSADIKNGNLVCEVDWNRTYELEKAYPKDPHLQFLNCATAEDLRRFAYAWGPLHLRTTGGAEMNGRRGEYNGRWQNP